jgi:hypothetical protein
MDTHRKYATMDFRGLLLHLFVQCPYILTLQVVAYQIMVFQV